ncbi:uncharacterized protein [Venturia canescens]|uniref:uncharacterized protein n=1 Tax=Venturia canescens TaxID=32260 RepID=UPI001C9C7DC7|nr:uncharacterized protein LOC122415356 [Venturia canescens]
MTQVYHQAKFRWTENLTSRFIQLRKENGKLFTGRKYSAQAGWEYILRRMRLEFPTIMADVHYRVLKKKWSNLLQQYKELKNPVHGDKNKADDVSWPFYSAIDEVVGNATRRRSNLGVAAEEEEEEEEEEGANDENVVDPHEFLCVSVTPEESDHEPKFPYDQEIERNDNPSIIALQRLRTLNEDCSIEIERLPHDSSRASRKIGKPRGKRALPSNDTLISRLPRATELSIKTVKRSGPAISVKDLTKLGFEPGTRNGDSSTIPSRNEVGIGASDDDYETRGRIKRSRGMKTNDRENLEHAGSNLERRFQDFLDYAKRRDDENREIMLRILQAVEKIAQKIQ